MVAEVQSTAAEAEAVREAGVAVCEEEVVESRKRAVVEGVVGEGVGNSLCLARWWEDQTVLVQMHK